MKKTLKHFLALVCAVAMLLNVASFAMAEEQAPREITIASNSVGDFSPFSSFGGNTSSRGHVCEGLYARLAFMPKMGIGFDGLEKQMAKTLTLSEDKLTCDIELYDYIYDNQGNHITAEDVVWCYEFGGQISDYFTNVGSVLANIEATGDYTLSLTINTTAPGVMERVLTLMPIVSKSWYENASDTDLSINPACTGTYCIEEYTTGSFVSLVPVENYWQTDDTLRISIDHQLYDRINYMCISEDASRTIALQNKEADVSSKVTPGDIGYFMNEDGTSKEGWTVSSEYRGSFMYLFFNCDESNVFADINLRKAVLYGIDSQMMFLGAGNTVNDGHALKTYGPTVAGDMNDAWLEEDYYDYNPELAAEYLEKAGYAPGELTIRIMMQNSADRIGAATVFQALLSQIGINVEILAYDTALFNSYQYEEDQWDVIFSNGQTNDYLVTQWESHFNEANYENGTRNFIHDEKLQELLKNACEIHDQESVDAFHEYLKEMAYGIGVYESVSYMVAQDKITYITLNGTQNLEMLSLELADDYVSAAAE